LLVLPPERACGQVSPGDPAISQLNQAQLPAYGGQMAPGPSYGAQPPNGQIPIGQMPGYTRQNMPAQNQSSARPGLWPGAAPQNAAPPRAPVGPPPPAGWNGAPAGQAVAQRPDMAAPAGPAGPAQQPPRAAWMRNNQQLFVDTIDLGGAKVAARVGREIILWSEVSGTVDDYLKAELAKPGAANVPAAEIEAARERLSREKLNHLIIVKLALIDARRKIPDESLQRVMDSIESDFDSKEVPKKLKEEKFNSVNEFDAALRAKGTSLERERRTYVESQVAFGWLQQATGSKHQVTLNDLLAYYQKHLTDYDYKAKARFEQLLVRVPNQSARPAAMQKIVMMGNEVWSGANFADVARAKSDGSTSAQGGVFDWTEQGSLASKPIDQALFSLEVGRLSEIIEDERAISIIRVIERKPAGRRSFLDVQDEIKEHLEKEKRLVLNDKMQELITKLREETPIWTIYDTVTIEEADNIRARKGSVEQDLTKRPSRGTRSAAAPNSNGVTRQ
jgi:parvulin-like peptidyl-prolyl isomerase